MESYNGILCQHPLPLVIHLFPLKVIVINMDLAKKLGRRNKVLQWEPTFPNPFSTKPLTPAIRFPALNAT